MSMGFTTVTANTFADSSTSVISDRIHVATIWRRDLVNLNKTRDNHMRWYGHYFDHHLLVRESSTVEGHIEQEGTLLHRFPNRAGLLGFWLRSLWWLRKHHCSQPLDAVILPIGEEPLALVLKFAFIGTKAPPKLVMDLWDVPGQALAGTDKRFRRRVARSLYLALVPLFLRCSDFVVAGVVPEVFTKMGVKPSQIIHSENAVLPGLFDPKLPADGIWRRGSSNSTETVKLLYQGYIHPSRGAIAMVEMVAVLRDQGHPVELLMVGPLGNDVVDTVEKMAVSKGVSEFVTLSGPVPSERIPAIIAGADICLCPLVDIEQYRWSYPVKIYEYMAMQKAIVASRLPGIECQIEDGVVGGCLYHPEDPSGLLTATKRLLEDREMAIEVAARGRAWVTERSWPKMMGRVCKQIETSLHRGER